MTARLISGCAPLRPRNTGSRGTVSPLNPSDARGGGYECANCSAVLREGKPRQLAPPRLRCVSAVSFLLASPKFAIDLSSQRQHNTANRLSEEQFPADRNATPPEAKSQPSALPLDRKQSCSNPRWLSHATLRDTHSGAEPRSTTGRQKAIVFFAM
jgi:hypothetical protein